MVFFGFQTFSIFRLNFSFISKVSKIFFTISWFFCTISSHFLANISSIFQRIISKSRFRNFTNIHSRYVLSYLSAISRSRIFKLDNSFSSFAFILSVHFLLTMIVVWGLRKGICFIKLSSLKARIISTLFVRYFSHVSLIWTSKKFTHHLILDSYSISVIRSYPSSEKRPVIISTVEFTQVHAGHAILIFRFIFSFFKNLFCFTFYEFL